MNLTNKDIPILVKSTANAVLSQLAKLFGIENPEQLPQTIAAMCNSSGGGNVRDQLMQLIKEDPAVGAELAKNPAVLDALIANERFIVAIARAVAENQKSYYEQRDKKRKETIREAVAKFYSNKLGARIMPMDISEALVDQIDEAKIAKGMRNVDQISETAGIWIEEQEEKLKNAILEVPKLKAAAKKENAVLAQAMITDGITADMMDKVAAWLQEQGHLTK